jgi:hypothetical protein
MLAATSLSNGTYDPCWSANDDQWRISLALDLEERSVLEGEVLLSRITAQSLASAAHSHPEA